MKKLFGMIAIVLLFSSVVFAKSKFIQRDMIQDAFAVRTVCTDGYKFVVVRDIQERYSKFGDWGTKSTTVSIVQFYENKNGNAVPARC